MIWLGTIAIGGALTTAIWIGMDWSHRGYAIEELEAKIVAQTEALHSERVAIAEWEAAYSALSEQQQIMAQRLAARDAAYNRLQRDTAARLAAISAAKAEPDRCLDSDIGGSIYGILRGAVERRGDGTGTADYLPENPTTPAATDADAGDR